MHRKKSGRRKALRNDAQVKLAAGWQSKSVEAVEFVFIVASKALIQPFAGNKP